MFWNALTYVGVFWGCSDLFWGVWAVGVFWGNFTSGQEVAGKWPGSGREVASKWPESGRKVAGQNLSSREVARKWPRSAWPGSGGEVVARKRPGGGRESLSRFSWSLSAWSGQRSTRPLEQVISSNPGLKRCLPSHHKPNGLPSQNTNPRKKRPRKKTGVSEILEPRKIWRGRTSLATSGKKQKTSIKFPYPGLLRAQVWILHDKWCRMVMSRAPGDLREPISGSPEISRKSKI